MAANEQLTQRSYRIANFSIVSFSFLLSLVIITTVRATFVLQCWCKCWKRGRRKKTKSPSFSVVCQTTEKARQQQQQKPPPEKKLYNSPSWGLIVELNFSFVCCCYFCYFCFHSASKLAFSSSSLLNDFFEAHFSFKWAGNGRKGMREREREKEREKENSLRSSSLIVCQQRVRRTDNETG